MGSGIFHLELGAGADDPMRVSQDWLDNTTDVLIELKQKQATSFAERPTTR